jgi:hypothetical protein
MDLKLKISRFKGKIYTEDFRGKKNLRRIFLLQRGGGKYYILGSSIMYTLH